MIKVICNVDKNLVNEFYQELVEKYTKEIVDEFYKDCDSLYQRVYRLANNICPNNHISEIQYLKSDINKQLSIAKKEYDDKKLYDEYKYDLSELKHNIKAVYHFLCYKKPLEFSNFERFSKPKSEDYFYYYCRGNLSAFEQVEDYNTAYLNLCEFFETVPNLEHLQILNDDYKKCFDAIKHLDGLKDLIIKNYAYRYSPNVDCDEGLKYKISGYYYLYGEIDSFVLAYHKKYKCGVDIYQYIYELGITDSVYYIDIFTNLKKDFPRAMLYANIEYYDEYYYRITKNVYPNYANFKYNTIEKIYKSKKKDNTIPKNLDKNVKEFAEKFDVIEFEINFDIYGYLKYCKDILSFEAIAYNYLSKDAFFNLLDKEYVISDKDFLKLRKTNPLIAKNGGEFYNNDNEYLIPNIDVIMSQEFIPITVYQIKKIITNKKKKDLLLKELNISEINLEDISSTYMITESLGAKLGI